MKKTTALATFGDRLKHAREHRRLSQAELSTKMGGVPTQAHISKLEKGVRAKSTLTMSFARALEINPDWLESKRGPMSVHDNVTEAPDIGGMVPLISWVQAGEWHHAADPFPPGGGEYVLSPVQVTEGMYALTVRGDSMFNPTGPKSYPDGCRIFVNPELRSPDSGAQVIAKVDGEDEVTFKQFVRDGSNLFLKPLNPQWPIITRPFRILGTVVAMAIIN